ncbi:DUF4189 domain-containing protein [Methylocystis sp. JR02]|uniref:DUF4189 domain-containing protein n=1 Tax=Methylocystis sp. JR02 TaxID=3046284 RepID=UPI0024BA5F07|nr:DUF4189 domain-containing protein [Methylocystis sp. JR02]MDJ0450804.1 DUF4189 domain-containing protein [Methylocystis sp. JR02]
MREASVCNQAKRMRLFAFILVTGITAQIAPADAEENLWGAIALGGNGFGASRGRPDENAAISGALRQCEESGGAGKCKIRLTYRNRCAAYASGDNREVAIAYADTMEKASKLAQRSCSEATKNCRIQYAACSVPSSFN